MSDEKLHESSNFTAFVLYVLFETVAPFVVPAACLAVPGLVLIVLIDNVLLLKTFE